MCEAQSYAVRPYNCKQHFLLGTWSNRLLEVEGSWGRFSLMLGLPWVPKEKWLRIGLDLCLKLLPLASPKHGL